MMYILDAFTAHEWIAEPLNNDLPLMLKFAIYTVLWSSGDYMISRLVLATGHMHICTASPV
jgi:hypothetical protein